MSFKVKSSQKTYANGVILVTGATGFIGRNIMKSLFDNGVEHVGLSRPQVIKQTRISNLVQAPSERWPKFITRLSPESIICCDWHGVEPRFRSDKFLQEKNYMRILLNIDSAIDSGCKKVMVLGSQAEYGENPLNVPISEDYKLYPQNAYSEQKVRLFDALFSKMQDSKSIFHWPVIFSVYGIGDREDSFVIQAIKSILEGKKFQIRQPHANWNFLHIVDLVRALLLIISMNDSMNRINIGHSVSQPLLQYGQEIADTLGRPDLLSASSTPASVGHNLNPSISKLTSLGWYPIENFQSGISGIYEHILRGSND